MFRCLFALSLSVLLAGCISFNTTESPGVPDYQAVCQDKETQCKAICADLGVQSFSCKAAPREGMEYRCECKKPQGKPL